MFQVVRGFFGPAESHLRVGLFFSQPSFHPGSDLFMR
ncbi:hypothetical protein SBA4_1810002 [Candidatus Sulfopaludibacter sp. SbA4]|nr:hypothetical protein SBA4_1810002 [Candidatus Sulfopaludibacter sp. SbA4]